jgi:ketosteroid isomerase-like protein
MSIRLTAALTALSCAFACISVARANEGALQATLQARYTELRTAMAAHDSKGIAAILTERFISVDVSGKGEGVTQMTGDLNLLLRDPNRISTTTIASLSQDGDTAFVSQRYAMKTVRPGADGIAQHVELVAFSDDTWVKARGAWLLQRSETNEVDYYVNGKRVAHKVKPEVGCE